MNLDAIRQRVSGGGFQPFALRTPDGHQYAVGHPEMVLVASRSLAVLDQDGEIVTLDPLHIVGIKNLRARKGPLWSAGNGALAAAGLEPAGAGRKA